MEISKKIDEGWKARVQLEMKKLVEKEAEAPNAEEQAKLDEYEAEFGNLMQSLMMQLETCLQNQDIESGKRLAKLIEGIEYKTREKQTLTEKNFFKQVLPQIRTIFEE